jgi:hypothetical protein
VNATWDTSLRSYALDVFAAVKRGPAPFSEIATRSGWSRDRTRHALAALVAVGWVAQERSERNSRIVIYSDATRDTSRKSERAEGNAPEWGELDLAIFDSLTEPRTIPAICRLVGATPHAIEHRLLALELAGHVACERTAFSYIWRQSTPLDFAKTAAGRVAVVLDHVPRRALDLATACRVSPESARQALRSLHAKGLAEPVGRGRSGATLWRAASPAR